MIKYRENRNNIIQTVEIDLTGITTEDRLDIKRKLDLLHKEYDNILEYDDKSNKLVYKTEVLTPKANKNRLSILMVLGNPAVHSVADKMIFSYEKTRNGGKREHRFWKALKELKVVELDIFHPNPEYNNYKRECLLNGNYHSDFNIFLLPYFSFPTPASGLYNGVNGIKKIVGGKLFNEMKEFEFQRFKDIVLCNNIKNVICFQKTEAGKEIICRAEGKQINNNSESGYPVYELGGSLKHVLLYISEPTRRLHTDEGKKILKNIVTDIKAKNKIG